MSDIRKEQMEQAEQKNNYLSLAEASKLTPYSQEYLSLRARQGKLQAKKIGRDWMTTNDWLDEYLAKVQSSLPAKKKQETIDGFISLQEASKHSKYSQEYLSLRVRQGKLQAKKIGRNWMTTNAWVDEYVGGVQAFKEQKRQIKKVVEKNENIESILQPAASPYYIDEKRRAVLRAASAPAVFVAPASSGKTRGSSLREKIGTGFQRGLLYFVKAIVYCGSCFEKGAAKLREGSVLLSLRFRALEETTRVARTAPGLVDKELRYFRMAAASVLLMIGAGFLAQADIRINLAKNLSVAMAKLGEAAVETPVKIGSAWENTKSLLASLARERSGLTSSPRLRESEAGLYGKGGEKSRKAAIENIKNEIKGSLIILADGGKEASNSLAGAGDELAWQTEQVSLSVYQFISLSVYHLTDSISSAENQEFVINHILNAPQGAVEFAQKAEKNVSSFAASIGQGAQNKFADISAAAASWPALIKEVYLNLDKQNELAKNNLAEVFSRTSLKIASAAQKFFGGIPEWPSLAYDKYLVISQGAGDTINNTGLAIWDGGKLVVSWPQAAGEVLIDGLDYAGGTINKGLRFAGNIATNIGRQTALVLYHLSDYGQLAREIDPLFLKNIAVAPPMPSLTPGDENYFIAINDMRQEINGLKVALNELQFSISLTDEIIALQKSKSQTPQSGTQLPPTIVAGPGGQTIQYIQRVEKITQVLPPGDYAKAGDLVALEARLSAAIAASQSAAISQGNSYTTNNFYSWSGSQKIDQLNNVVITNGTLSGSFNGTVSATGVLTAAGGVNISGGDLTLTGGFYDSLASAGADGQILQSTGSATEWVSTSTLFSSGVDILPSGAQGQTLTYQNAAWQATSTLYVSAAGNVGIGTTSPYSLLSISNSKNTAANTPLFTIASTTAGTATSTLLTVLANGNVGIGTTEPGQALEVNGNIKLSSAGYIYGDGNTNVRLSNASGAYLTYDGNNYLSIGNNNTSLAAGGIVTMTLKTGNVGIGTTTPFAKLSVAGDIYASGGTITASGFVATSSISAPYFTATDASATSTFAGGLTVNTDTFVVDPDAGRVGIGTASPGYKLDVTGTGNFTDNISMATGKYLYIGGVGTLNIGDAGDTINIGVGKVSVPETGAVTFGSGLRMADNIKSLFGNSNDASIYYDGSNMYVNPREVGTGNLIINSGNVGIGTTSPLAKLDVAGSLSQTSPLFQVSKVGAAYATTTALIVDSSGNVGIGTAAPGTVTPNGWSSGSRLLDIVSLDNGHDAGLLLSRGDGVTGSHIWHDGSSWDLYIDNYYSNDTANIYFRTKTAGTPVNAMTILGSGNVGIGTTTPQWLLNPTSATASQLALSAGAGVAQWAFRNAGGNLYVAPTTVAGTATSTTALTILNNGNVGIGTTTPSQELDVAGFINTDQYSGYKQNGNTVLYASTTNASLSVGASAAANWMAATSTLFYDVAIGQGALATVQTDFSRGYAAYYNTAAGFAALNLNNGGYMNSAFGAKALNSNTSGYYNTAVGGYATLYANTTGYQNTAIGYRTLSSNVSGNSNTAYGFQALYSSTGSNNVALGSNAGYNETGDNNFYVGNIKQTTLANDRSYSLLYGTFSGVAGSLAGQQLVINGNVGIGTTSPAYKLDVAGFINTDQYSGYKQAGNTILYASSTNSSTLVGQSAGAALLSDGLYNTALGFEALKVATSTDNNTAVGYQALYKNTTGSNNTANGYASLYGNTTGSNNTANGYQALYGNTTGSNNTANGYQALYSNNTGSGNAALGYGALANNASATSSTAIGYRAGVSAYSQGAHNQGGVFVGYQTGYNLTTGSDYNTLLGYQSGYDITTGANNLILGTEQTTGSGVTTGSNNILLGKGVRYGLDGTASNQLNIGNLIFATGLGSENTLSSGNVGIGTTSPYAKLAVVGDLVVSGGTITGATVIATSSFSAPYFTATDASATSTFAGGLAVDTDGLVYDWQTRNVGIGTASPTAKLQVSGTSSYNAAISLSATNANGYSRLELDSVGNLSTIYNFGNTYVTSGKYIQASTLIDATGAGGLTLNAGTSDAPIRFYTVGTEKVRIQSDGNVGIGTANPDATLAVVGNAYFSGSATSTFGGPVVINPPTNNGSASLTITHNTTGSDNTHFLDFTSAIGAAPSSYFDRSGNYHGGTAFVNSVGSNGNTLNLLTNGASRMSLTSTALSSVTSGGAQITLSASSATVPGFTFVGDTSTGLGRDALGLYLISNGATVLTAASTGNVGIGTTSPYAKLAVVGDLVVSGGTITGSTIVATSSFSAPYFTATDAAATSTFAGGLAVDTDGLVYDWQTNKVGIGTASPTEKLTVYGNGPDIGLKSSASSMMKYSFSNDATGEVGYLGHQWGTGMVLNAVANYPMYFKISEVTKMMIDTTGNVGIGTTTPSALLHIASATSGGSGQVMLEIERTNTIGLRLLNYDGGTGSFRLQRSTNFSTWSDVMAIDSNGDIGIGTSSPLAKLDIAGSLSQTTPLFQVSKVGAAYATTTALIVDSTGNVGIGTTGPSQKLHVVVANAATEGVNDAIRGTVAGAPTWDTEGGYFANTTTGTGTGYGVYGIATGAGTKNIGGYFSASGATTNYGLIVGSGNVGIGTTSPTALTHIVSTAAQDLFRVDDDGAGDTSPFVINRDGNVGIGTSSPSSKLTVAGSVNVQNFASSGTVTQANTKISAVANTAFVDFTSAPALTPYVGKRIIVTDSTGKKITGYIKAAGTGETLDAEALTSWAQSSPAYDILTSSGKDITSAIEASGPAVAVSNSLGTSGSLLKLVATVTQNSGASPTWRNTLLTITYGTGSGTFYIVNPGTLKSLVGGPTNFSAVLSVKQVLTPSATGATIVSTPGGSTYSWTSQESGFDYNDASGYTYQIVNDSDTSVFALTNTVTGDLFNMLNTGNVGIGTTTPTSLLQIANATAPKLTISDTNADADQKHWFIESNTGSFAIGTTSDSLVTNAAYRALTINSAGNVGIGTSSPSKKLSVSGALYVTSASHFGSDLQVDGALNVDGNFSVNTTYLTVDSATGNTYMAGGLGVGIATTTAGVVQGTGMGYFGGSLYTGGELYVTATTTLSGALEISGNATSTGNLGTSGHFYALGNISTNGVFYSSDGSETLPSYTFGSDLNTGIFRAAADELAFTTAGSEGMRIDSSGNVGIGTTSPGNLLHISSAGSSILRLENSNANIAVNAIYGGLYFEGQDDSLSGAASGIRAKIIAMGEGISGETGLGFYTSNASGGGFNVDATDSEVLRIANTGLVGIGTTTPSAKLHILQTGTEDAFRVDDILADASPFVIKADGNVGIGTTTPNTLLTVKDSFSLFDSTSPYDTLIKGYRTSDDGILDIYENNSVGVRLSGSATMDSYFNVTGSNVGIGTTTPNAKLNIYSTSDPIFKIEDNGGAQAYIQPINSSRVDMGTLSAGDDLALISGGAEAIRILASGNIGIGTTSPASKLDIWGDLRVGTSATPALFVNTTTGFVGIGTTSPFAKLSVAGDIYATGGTITASGFVATSSISAPYFTATDASATSTFAGGLAVDTSGLVYDWQTGNVGIGTASPTEKLTVLGNENLASPILVTSNKDNFGYGLTGTGTGGSTYGLWTTAGGSGWGQGNFLIVENTSPRLTIQKTTGNVGIGTTNPSTNLSFGGDSAVTIGMERVSTDTGGKSLTIQAGGAPSNPTQGRAGGNLYLASGSSYASGSSLIYLQTASSGAGASDPTTKVTIDGTGHLGISTNSSPAAWLDVNPQTATGQIAGVLLNVHHMRDVNDVEGFKIESISNSDPQMRYSFMNGNVGIGTTSPLAKLDVAGSLSQTTPLFQVSKVGASYATTTALIVNSTGNVGIGTTSPTYTLDIEAAAAKTLVKSTTGTNGAFMETSNTGGWFDIGRERSAGGLILTGSTGYAAVLAASGTYPMQFGVNDGIVMTMLSDGNVGIGTTTPGYNLTVAGTSFFTNTLWVGPATGNKVGDISWTSTDTGMLDLYSGGVQKVMLHTNGSSYFNGGSVGIGASPSTSYNLDVAANGSTGNGAILRGDGTGIGVYGYNDGSGVGVEGYSATGYGVYCNASACGGNVAWTPASDIRLKQNIADLPSEGGLDAILALRPVTYHWKDAALDSRKGEQLGFIAQEVRDVLPQLVVPGLASTTITLADGSTEVINDSLALDYSGLAVPLVKAIQELYASSSPLFTGISIDSAFGTSSPFMSIDALGNIGIGTSTPAVDSGIKMAVGGDIAATGFVNLSTREAKKDIEYLSSLDYENVLAKISEVKVATYYYNSEDPSTSLCSAQGILPEQGGAASKANCKRLGLIAEEAPLEVLSADGKGVDLYKLTSFTLAGVKTLDAKVNGQQITVNSLESRVATLESAVASGALNVQANFNQALQTLGGDTIELAPSSIAALVDNMYASVLSGLRQMGLIVEQGIVRAQKLVASILQADKLTINTTPAQGDPTIGSGQVNVGEMDTYIINNQVSTTTKIFVTPDMPVAVGICERHAQPEYVGNVQRPQGFRVCVNATSTQIISFSWWIVDTTADSRGSGTAADQNAENSTPPLEPVLSSPKEGGGGDLNPSPSPLVSPEPVVSTASSTPLASPEATATPTETPVVTPEETPIPTPTETPIVSETPTPTP